MAEVIWTVRAYEHLFQIGEYIIKDSPFQAKRVIQLIIKETQRLENSTRVGHLIPEIKNDHYRELRVFSYRILYKILAEEKVAIIGIVHSKRILDPEILK
jgi:plasmid stabilization system protein ParE